MKKTQNAKSRGTFALLKNVGPNLFRHKENGNYYGMKKVGGKRVVHALGTAHGVTASTLLREWLDGLAAVGPGNVDLNLGMLVENFLRGRAGRSVSTRGADERISREFRASFPRAMSTKVADVVHSDIAAWLAEIKPGKRNSTFNRWRLFARQLFELSEADGAVKKSPFIDRLNRPAKKQKVERHIPSAADFERILAEIRVPSWAHVKGKRGGQRPMRQDESADFAEFLGRAGVGQAEAASIRWEDVGERALKFVRAKTGKEFAVLITANLRPMLERRRLAAGGANASGPVFKIKNIKTALNHALARLGMRHYSQRNFRSFKIVTALARGVDVKFVAAEQGHGDGGKLIYDTYSEVVRENQRAYEDEQLARMEGRAEGRKVVAFTPAAAA